MAAPGVFRGVRVREVAVSGAESKEAEERRAWPAGDAGCGAMRALLAVYPVHEGGGKRRCAGLRRPRLFLDNCLPSGPASRQQLLAEHRGYLPGRGADLE